MSDKNVNKSLSVLSEEFDALNALYSENIVIPWKKAPVLDNVAKYEALEKISDGSTSLDKVLSGKNTEISKKKEEKLKNQQVVVERQFSLLKVEPKEVEEVDDLEIQEKRRQRMLRRERAFDNVLTLAKKMAGPMGFLNNCMEHRIRVKVWTRNEAAIRGFSHGFVVAFDKHWNIAMEDATEEWRRKIKRKTAPIGISSEPPPDWKRNGPPLKPPPIEIIAKDKKMETCRRYIRQIMIRGEQVVMISVISS